jgi:hypothetical protein
MTGAQRRIEKGSALWVAVLILGMCHCSHAEERPASTPSSAAKSPSSESDTPDAARADDGKAPPAEEAPSLGGPSGAGGAESGSPEAAPSGGSEEQQPAPDVEAPTLGGPSGSQMRPEGEGAGRDAPWWTRVPNVQPFPPMGNALVPPRGSGYYTFWEMLRGDRREAPPKYPYPRFEVISFPFFNADWRYLDAGEDRDRDFFDLLKRIPLGENFLFTTGGEWRVRYDNEVNSRLSSKDNVYELTRTRVYGDLWFRDLFRIYGEFINAQSFEQDLLPLLTDQENPNFIDLFADAKLGTIRDRPLWLRGGRQELLYGSQRLVSPADWGNTRRTFQGGKLFWQNEKSSLDVFCVQPVVPSANSFSSVAWQQVFSGIWGTYRPVRGEIIDLYYLNLQDSTLIFAGQNGVRGAQNLSTVGSRWYGDKNNWLWDTEAMLQFGRYSNQGILANAYTMGGGYYFSKVRLNPTLWIYYDYASGDPDPGATGVHHTFNTLFPTGHYYFGMMDLVGRQNIHDVHADLSFFPIKWWTVWLQYHVLRLDSAKDALYSTVGIPERVDPTGKAGINVGEIFTVVNNFTLDLHQNVFVQYAHLYAGDFLIRTGKEGSADEVYLMYSYRW